MPRYNVTNVTTSMRKFAAGDRFLTLMGGEAEKNIELGDDEVAALKAAGEFKIVKLDEKPAVAKQGDVK